jgi:RNA polymerase sigma-70 factor (ECF subfamily)
MTASSAAGAGVSSLFEVERSCVRNALSDLPEEQIIELCQVGNREAHEVLFDRYRVRAFWTAYSFLGNRDEAKDVVQDSFLRVFKSIKSFKPGNPFYPWFYRLVVNLAIDMRRSAASRDTLSLDVFPFDAAGDPEPDEFEQDVTSRAVLMAIRDLPDIYCTVMILVDIQGFRDVEAARILEISYPAARWRLFRARQLFKGKWEQRGDDYLKRAEADLGAPN